MRCVHVGKQTEQQVNGGGRKVVDGGQSGTRSEIHRADAEQRTEHSAHVRADHQSVRVLHRHFGYRPEQTVLVHAVEHVDHDHAGNGQPKEQLDSGLDGDQTDGEDEDEQLQQYTD